MDLNIANIVMILRENARRKALLDNPYNQLTGLGCCGPRVTEKPSPFNGDRLCHIPAAMAADRCYPFISSVNQYQRLRIRYDFEYWAETCAVIKDKLTSRDCPFRLNTPQRRVLAFLEQDRLAGLPIRLIMLKARQWGGSTLVQMYMAWIQCVLVTNHHSLICAHVKDTASTIRGMYTKLLQNYPRDLWDGDEGVRPAFRAFEGSDNTRVIAGRGNRVTIGSSSAQDSIRGADYAMAHLSEVAFWGDSDHRNPDDMVRGICGAVALEPLTLVVMESTANGVGNYFHREWLRCQTPQGDKHAVFIPWYEIEIYRKPLPPDITPFISSIDEYEQELWRRGCTLEMIYWYHLKRREYASHAAMMAEFPTTADEAFTNTGVNVFDVGHINRMRACCLPPPLVGEIVGEGPAGRPALRSTRFVHDPKGHLGVWKLPRDAHRYVVAVDIGGRTSRADRSVILVMDATAGSMPEVVAQWTGNIDHDILAWKAATVARHYNRAELIFESNTLETELTDGDPSSYILNQLVSAYPRLYYRHSLVDGVDSCRPGFHTNRATKTMIITGLIAALRDGTYIERDAAACDEFATYEQRPDGTYAARRGCHDDRLITRAIALHVIRSRRPA